MAPRGSRGKANNSCQEQQQLRQGDTYRRDRSIPGENGTAPTRSAQLGPIRPPRRLELLKADHGAKRHSLSRVTARGLLRVNQGAEGH